MPSQDSEIHKLEQRHAENPGGRFFMPLAEAYRKSGELERAEQLLRDGLRAHPEYLSAHVALGRLLAVRGNQDGAVDQFRHVLNTDPQNLIALRSLGEIAHRAGRSDEAIHWYQELLNADPLNGEAPELLEALRSTAAAPLALVPPADVSSVEPPTVAAPGTDEFDPADAGLLDLERSAYASADVGAEAAPSAAPSARSTGLMDSLMQDRFSAAGVNARLRGDQGDADAMGGPEVLAPLPISASAGLPSAETGTAAGTDAGPAGPGPDDADDDQFWGPAGREHRASELGPDDAWGMVELTPFADDVPAADATGPEFARGDNPPTSEASTADAGAEMSWNEPSADEPLLPRDPAPATDLPTAAEDELVTETIAELYARQGLLAQAADAYRRLLARNGEQPAWVRRLAELEVLSATAGSASPPQPHPSVAQAIYGVAEHARSDADSPGRATSAVAPMHTFGEHLPPVFPPASAVIAEPVVTAISAEAHASGLGLAGLDQDSFANSFANGFEGAAAPVGTAAASADGPDSSLAVPAATAVMAPLVAETPPAMSAPPIAPAALGEPGRARAATIRDSLTRLLAWTAAPAPHTAVAPAPAAGTISPAADAQVGTTGTPAAAQPPEAVISAPAPELATGGGSTAASPGPDEGDRLFPWEMPPVSQPSANAGRGGVPEAGSEAPRPNAGASRAPAAVTAEPAPSRSAPTAPATPPAAAPANAGADDADDLESFQAWLQSLKR